MKLAVVGLGKLGGPLAAVLAGAGHDVVGFDPYAPAAVAAINEGLAPVDEPGLAELIAGLPPDALTATGYLERALDGARAAYVVVPTPSGPDGRFESRAVVEAVSTIARLGNPTIVVVSTLSPGSIAADVVPAADGLPVVYSPLFIALGSVLRDLTRPDLVLIGADDPMAGALVERIARGYLDGVNRPVFARVSPLEAEIVKLAVNTFLVTKIGFANAIEEACSHLGADPVAVLETIGSDHRIGRAYLAPGGPAGGPCLPRDSAAMVEFLTRSGAPAELAVAADSVNRRQVGRTVDVLAGFSRVAVLGLAYKPGTSVTERSFGLEVAAALHARGVDVYCHDPVARPRAVRLCGSARDAVVESDAVLIATPWDEYRALDLAGRFVVDPWQLQLANREPAPGLTPAEQGKRR